MSISFPMPFEIRKAVMSFLRHTAQTIEFREKVYLVSGQPRVEDADRAWINGAVTISDSGEIFLCGAKITYNLDPVRVKRKVVQHLHSNLSTSDLVGVAGMLGLSLK